MAKLGVLKAVGLIGAGLGFGVMLGIGLGAIVEKEREKGLDELLKEAEKLEETEEKNPMRDVGLASELFKINRPGTGKTPCKFKYAYSGNAKPTYSVDEANERFKETMGKIRNNVYINECMSDEAVNPVLKY